jgi:hypothetical protein
MDLYDVEFGRISGLDYTIKTIAEGIYFDGLIPLFEETTGLRTSL